MIPLRRGRTRANLFGSSFKGFVEFFTEKVDYGGFEELIDSNTFPLTLDVGIPADVPAVKFQGSQTV